MVCPANISSQIIQIKKVISFQEWPKSILSDSILSCISRMDGVSGQSQRLESKSKVAAKCFTINGNTNTYLHKRVSLLFHEQFSLSMDTHTYHTIPYHTKVSKCFTIDGNTNTYLHKRVSLLFHEYFSLSMETHTQHTIAYHTIPYDTIPRTKGSKCFNIYGNTNTYLQKRVSLLFHE